MKKVLRIIPSIILYLLAITLLVYAIWVYNHCAEIVSQAIEMGQLDAVEGRYDIINFYMSSCGQYFIFAFLFAALGLVLQRKPVIVSDSAVSAPLAKEQVDDKILDGIDGDEETEDNAELNGEEEQEPGAMPVEEPDYKQYERPENEPDEAQKDKP